MQKTTQISQIFIIICGVSMFAAWGFFFLIGFISKELIHIQISYRALLYVECLMALGLIIGGIALITKKIWGSYLSTISLGMLLYSVMIGTGEFLPHENIFLSCLFMILWLSTLTLLFNKLTIFVKYIGGFTLQSQME